MILCLIGLGVLISSTGMAEQILVHGHRGARAVRPENTLPAFEYAIAAGADVLEMDLAVTKDNVLVVSHDPEMNAKFCDGPKGTRIIREMTLEQLRAWDCGGRVNPDYPRQQAMPGTRVPTLDEVLALAPRGKFQFNIETKIFRKRPEVTPPPAEFARLIAESIRRHQLVSRVIVQSFDFRTLQAMKLLMPSVRLAALHEGTPKDFAVIAKEAGARIVSPHHSLVTPEQVRRAHKAGLQVVPWTANTPEQWQKLADAKVDAIISDDPAALLSWLRKKKLHP